MPTTARCWNMTAAAGRSRRGHAYGLGPNAVLDEMDVAAGTRQTLVPDVQGSIIASLDSGTGTLTKIGYQAYGEHPGLTSGSYRYTAQRFDPETAGSSAEPSGLYDYRARIYSPTLGRFLQPDPAGYVAGTNLYAYVNNDPLDNTDPSGQVKDAVTQGLSYAYNNPLQVAGIGLAIGATIVAPLNSAALPEEIAGIEATAEVSEAAESEAGLASTAGGGAPGAPDFVVTSGGDAIPVPQGATGPVPTNSPGFQFNGGAGGNGLAPNVTDVRIMEPNAQNPTGYVNYGSQQSNGGWQSVNPYTGQSIPPSNPWWHIPINTGP